MSSIARFAGPYWFLSNFSDAVVTYRGLPHRTLEHAFQAAKTHDVHERLKIYHALSPHEAKRLGRHVTLRPDWENIKQRVMLRLLRRKFRNSMLRSMLLSTGNKTLIEGNNWQDTYWGVCGGFGHNHLGKLLMQVRREVRDGTAT